MAWTDNIVCIDVLDRKARRACRQCDVPLEGRRTAYCSDSCERLFAVNHFWDKARREIERIAKRLGNGIIRCQRFGCDATDWLEINHIDPVRGGPRFATCKNHLENLEILCHSHHLEATELQFRPEKVLARIAQAEFKVALPME